MYRNEHRRHTGRFGRRLVSFLLALSVLAGVLPALQSPAAAADVVNAQPLTSSNLNGGVYYLTDNVSYANGMRIQGNVVIDLNGYTLRVSQYTAGEPGIYLPYGSSLTFVGTGSVVAYGANGSNGESGNVGTHGSYYGDNARHDSIYSQSTDHLRGDVYATVGQGGAGGRGGYGGGAGIGTSGGAGGNGALMSQAPLTIYVNNMQGGTYTSGTLSRYAGNAAESGRNAAQAGTLRLFGNVRVTAGGGAGGAAGGSVSYSDRDPYIARRAGCWGNSLGADTVFVSVSRGGNGGGGGGGGKGAAFGTGGGGGGGGSAGSQGAVHRHSTSGLVLNNNRYFDVYLADHGYGGRSVEGNDGSTPTDFWEANGSVTFELYQDKYSAVVKIDAGAAGHCVFQDRIEGKGAGAVGSAASQASGSDYYYYGTATLNSSNGTAVGSGKKFETITGAYGSLTVQTNFTSEKDPSKNDNTAHSFAVQTSTTKLGAVAEGLQNAVPGYTLEGLYSDAQCTQRIANADGTLVDGIINQYVANGRWNAAAPRTLYAKWTPASYSIRLDANGGKGGSVVTAAYDSTTYADGVAIPTRQGFTFDGYWTEPGYHCDADTLEMTHDGLRYMEDSGSSGMQIPAVTAGETGPGYWNFAENTTLYAHWKPLTYNIDFYTVAPSMDDGSYYVATQEDVVYGDLNLRGVELIPEQLRLPNYTFLGWNVYAQQDWAMYYPGQTYQVGLAGNEGETVPLYAAWKENEKLTVSFNPNGGRGEPQAQQVYIHNDLTLPTAVPTRDGFSFAGWSTDPAAKPGDAGVYPAGGKLTDVTQGVMLYAVWTQNPSLTYHPNGGSFPTFMATEYPPVNTQWTLTDREPERIGYTFAGWNTQRDGSGDDYPASGTFLMPDSDVVLYAQWKPKQYTVSVQLDGNAEDVHVEPDIQNQSYDYGAQVEFSLSSSQSMTGDEAVYVYVNGRAVKLGVSASGKYLFTVEDDSVVVVTRTRGYAVAYDPNGGSGMPVDAKIYQTGDSVSVKDNITPRRTGYTFAGWGTDAEGGTVYQPGESFDMGEADIVLYAQWEPIRYTVRFYKNSATAAGPTSVDVSFTYDVTQALTLPENSTDGFVEAGKSVRGWALGAAEDVTYRRGSEVKNLTSIQGDVVELYAKWQTRETKLILDPNGGSHGQNIGFVYVAYGDTPTSNLTPPVWEGYTFKGYYQNPDGTGRMFYNEALEPSVTSWNVDADECTVYAKWEPITYSIHFYYGNALINYFSLENLPYDQPFTLPTLQDLSAADTVFAQFAQTQQAANRYLKGWAVAPNSTYTNYTDAEAFASGLTTTAGSTISLYAVFQDMDTFRVTYNANGGSGAPESVQGYLEGQTVSVLFDPVPQRPGYEFLGWAESVNAVQPTYTAEGEHTFTMGGDHVTLFAVWRAYETFDVHFDANADDASVFGMPDTQSKVESVPLRLSATLPMRPGYTFKTWNTAADGQGDAYAPGAVYEADAEVTLYAQWTAVAYTLSVNTNSVGALSIRRNGTEIFTKEQTSTADSPITLTYGDRLEFTATGLTEGTNANAFVTLFNGRQLSGADPQTGALTWSCTVTGDISVVLLSSGGGQSAITYYVVYDSNDGTQRTKEQRQATDHPLPLYGADTFARTGWTLAGWSTAPSGSVDYALEYLPATPLSSVLNSRITLYAVWSATSVTVTLQDDQAAPGNPGSIQVVFGGTYRDLPELSKDGYYFDGWFTQQSGGTLVDRYTSVTNSAPHTLYARWTKIERYHITVSGGYVGEYDGQSHTLRAEVRPKALQGITYQWYKNGSILHGATLDELDVRYSDDSGEYVCRAKGWDEDSVDHTLESASVTVAITGASAPKPSGGGGSKKDDKDTDMDDQTEDLFDQTVECRRGRSCPLYDFDDLDPMLWYHDGIHYVLKRGLMNGIGGAQFAPNNTVTRAQIVTIIWRMEGAPRARFDAGFTDVAPGSWYADAVSWAAAAGIVTGYDAETFGPDDVLTREQFATIIYRYADYKEYTVATRGDFGEFSDAGMISDYARPAMIWANKYGLITGVSMQQIMPKGSATRAQAATIFYRFCGAFDV